MALDFTDQELAAATEAVVDNIMKPLSLEGIAYYVVKSALHGFVQRQCANCLTAAARTRQQGANHQ